MPTKTRLDPQADGDGPSAEPHGAQGSSPGDESSSASAGPPAGVTGFIDALNSMSAHIKARQAMEAESRRALGGQAALAGALLAAQALVDLFLLNLLRSYASRGWNDEATVALLLIAGAAVPAALALVQLADLASRPLRLAPDSVDRVALRHEDSPVRDRIRISQWILFDTVFTRFALAQRALSARVPSLLLAIALWATVATWSCLAAGFYLPGTYFDQGAVGAWNLTAAALWVVLSLASFARSDRRRHQELGIVRHYARQVLAFDRDFGGFLPRVERERVEAALGPGAQAEPDE